MTQYELTWLRLRSGYDVDNMAVVPVPKLLEFREKVDVNVVDIRLFFYVYFIHQFLVRFSAVIV